MLVSLPVFWPESAEMADIFEARLNPASCELFNFTSPVLTSLSTGPAESTFSDSVPPLSWERGDRDVLRIDGAQLSIEFHASATREAHRCRYRKCAADAEISHRDVDLVVHNRLTLGGNCSKGNLAIRQFQLGHVQVARARRLFRSLLLGVAERREVPHARPVAQQRDVRFVNDELSHVELLAENQ